MDLHSANGKAFETCINVLIFYKTLKKEFTNISQELNNTYDSYKLN